MPGVYYWKNHQLEVEGEGEMPILVLLSLELGIRERLSCVLLVCAIGVQEIM